MARSSRSRRISLDELRALEAEAVRGLLGFPSGDASPGFECHFLPTFHSRVVLFVSLAESSARLVARVPLDCISAYVDAVAHADSTHLGSVREPAVVASERALNEPAPSQLRALIEAAIPEIPAHDDGRRGRDGMVVDVVLRDPSGVHRRTVETVNDVGTELVPLLVHAVDLGIALLDDASVVEPLRAVRGYLR